MSTRRSRTRQATPQRTTLQRTTTWRATRSLASLTSLALLAALLTVAGPLGPLADAITNPTPAAAQTQTTFEVTSSGTVDDINIDGTPGHDFDGTTFTVRFTPLASSPDGCSTGATKVFTIGSTGNLTSPTTNLINTPAGETDQCEYWLTFTRTPALGLRLDGSPFPSQTVRQGSADLRFNYTDVERNDEGVLAVFHPNIDISVPQYDEDGEPGRNVFTAAKLPVDIDPVTDDIGCGDIGAGYNVQRRGAVVYTGSNAININDKDGTRCEYRITFTSSWSDTDPQPDGTTRTRELRLQPGHSRDFNHTNSIGAQSLQATYHAITRFQPIANIVVPPRTGTGTDSTFTGTTFEVSYVRQPGSHEGCSAATPVSVTYTVDTEGNATTTDTQTTLVDRPLGETSRCIYNVTTPTEKTQGTDSLLDWTLTRLTGHTTQISATANAVTANYDVGDITFAPEVAITVPPYERDNAPGTNWFEGEAITVEFDKATGPNNCTPDDTGFTYTVQPGGSSTTSSENRLIDYPAGQTTRCTYTATYPTNEDGGTDLQLITTGADAPDTSSDATDRTTRASYDAQPTFNPQLDFTVKYIDDTNNPGSNVLAAETITATYAPIDDPAQNAACSGFGAAPDPTETYTVGSGGTVMDGGMVDGPETAADLVDRPRGETTRCRYRVDLTDSIGTGDNQIDAVVGDGQSIAATETLVVEYSNNFIPLVVLDLPDYDRDGAPGTNFFEGAVFGIAFDRADAARTNCSPAGTHNYVVQTDGSLLPQDNTFNLVSRPQGEAACVYTVTLPPDVTRTAGAGVPVGWELTRQTTPPPTAMVSSASPTITGTYLAKTSFALDLTIGVPHRSQSRKDIPVNLQQWPSGQSNCSANSQKTYTIGGDYSATPTGGPPVFTDRLSGTTTRCNYRALFDSAPWPLVFEGSRFRTFTGGTSLTFNYISGRFNPNFVLDVPTYERDNEPGVNFYDGLEISPSIAPTSDSSSGCTSGSTIFRWTNSRWEWPSFTRVLPAAYGAGSADLCVYDVTYPSQITSAEGVQPGYTLTLQSGSRLTISEPAANRDFRPRYSFVSHFTPDIDFTVPYIARGASNALAGQTVTVEYTPITSTEQHADCLAATEIYTIAAGRSAANTAVLEFVSPNEAATLIDRPDGTTDRCRYTVNYSDTIVSGSTTLSLTTPDNVEIGALSDLAATYAGNISFEPNITITVPQYDREGEAGTNFFTGAEFEVTFNEVAGNPDNCSPDGTTITYVVPAGGIVETSGANTLVGIPAGAAVGESCDYTANFPDSEPSPEGVSPAWTLNRQGGTATASANINQGSAEVIRRYGAPASSFTPTVAIRVSPNNPTGSRNLFAGTTFEVSFANGTAPDGSSLAGCSPVSPATAIDPLTYTVQPNGDVTLTSGTLPSLVDRPEGADDRCVYAVITPQDRTQQPGSELTWTLARQTGHTESIDGNLSAVDADYEVGNITFEPDIDVTLPNYDRDGAPGTNWFEGEILEVRFTRSGGPATGCSGGMAGELVQYTVQDGGGVSGTTALVDYPAGETAARCIYEVTYPTSEMGGTQLQLVTTGPNAPDTFTEAPDRPTSATYQAQTSFNPSPDFSVPFVDNAAPTGENDLAGQTISVSYALVGDPLQNSACTGFGAATAGSETWTIGTGGSVVAGGEVSITGSDTAASLVDRPLGQTTRCLYEATFPASVGTASTGMFDRSTPEMVEFDASEATTLLTPRYSGDVTFTAMVSITVPQENFREDDEDTEMVDESMINKYTGIEFTVSFESGTGPPSGCTAAEDIPDLTYTVQSTGTVTTSDTLPTLVGLPDGQTMPCSYAVTFTEWVASTATRERLRRQTGFSTSVSASSATASASYDTGATLMLANLNFVVPTRGDHAVNMNNIYEGVEFVVTFRRPTTADLNCGTHEGEATGTDTYWITDAGTVVGRPDAEFDYMVNQVLGVDGAADVDCSYEVEWPALAGSVLRLLDDPPSDTVFSSTEFDPTAHYESLLSFFTPTASITVPQVDANNDDINDYAGTNIVVTFTRATEPPAGMPKDNLNTWCDASATITYRVRAGGEVTRHSGADRLVGAAAGLAGKCSYNVSFPAMVTPVGAAYSRDIMVRAATPPPTATVSDTDTEASAAYGPTTATTFTPTLAVMVPDEDGLYDLDGTAIDETTRSAFTDLEFVVSIANGEGPASGCTTGINNLTYTIQPGGTSSLTAGTLPTLVGYPASSAVPCSYAVSFPQWVSAPFPVATPRIGNEQLLLQPNVERLLTSATDSFTGTYVKGGNLARAVADVDVPSREYSGIEFRVEFTPVVGSDPRCVAGDGSTTAVVIYRSTDAGTVPFYGPDLTFASFVVSKVYGTDANGNLLMSGGNRDSSQDITCSYDLAWPPFASHTGNAYVLRLRTVAPPGDTPHGTVFSSVNNPATPSDETAPKGDYVLASTRFSPSVAITAPQIDLNNDGTNDFAGTDIVVTFTRSAEPPEGMPADNINTWCTASATERHRVRNNGDVTREGAAANLVGSVTGSAGTSLGNCTYNVTFPPMVTPAAAAHSSDNLARAAAPPPTATVTETLTAATAAYGPTNATNFTATVDITYPVQSGYYDIEGTAVDETTQSAFTGLEFVVSFAAGTGPDMGCSDKTDVTYTIGTDGNITGTHPTLVGYPAGVSVGCSYAVTFPEWVTALFPVNAPRTVIRRWLRLPGQTSSVNAGSTDAIVTYADGAEMDRAKFVDIDPPTSEALKAGGSVSEFSGAEFRVTFTRVAEADPRCVAGDGSDTASITFQARDPNSVTVKEEDLTAASFMVLTVYGTDENGDLLMSGGSRDSSQDVTCNYDIGYPTVARELILDQSSVSVDESETVSTPANRANTSVYPEVKYILDITRFAPNVWITVPQIDDDTTTNNIYSGTQFTVSYARTADPTSAEPRGELAHWCTATASETYQVRDDGSVTLEGTAASLVDSVAAFSGNCSYNVTFLANEDGANNRLTQASTPAPVATEDDQHTIVPATATDPEMKVPTTYATVSYASTSATELDATASITVPPFDDDTTAGNDFAGAVITISIAPAASVPAAIRSDCTSATFTTTVQSSGDLMPDPADWMQKLVDRPAGSQSDPTTPGTESGTADPAALPRCTYTVTHTIDNTALATDKALAAVDGATATLDHANTAISVIYGLAQASTFNAAVTITVPDLDMDNGGAGDGINDFTGASFDVEYAPDANAAQCAPLTAANAYTETYVVGTTRTAALTQSTQVDLTFRWAGAYQAADQCTWSLDFPTLVVATSGAGVALDDDTDDPTATVDDPAASADYDNSGTALDVMVALTVPQFNDDGDTANDFSGTTIRVNFTSDQTGCINSSADYTVDDDGNVMLDGREPALVDRPVGVMDDADRCRYTVVFPPTVASTLQGADGTAVDLLLRAGTAPTVRFDSTSASGTYDSDATTFAPALTLAVPQYLGDDSANNAFAGVEFTVTYSSATAGCVASATESYVVGNGGTVALAQPAPPLQPTRASLTDRPARTTNVRCSFDIAFASDALDGTPPTLLLATGATTTISRSAAALTVAFDNALSEFTPTVSIDVPQVDHMSGENVFAGAVFTVTFAAGTGPASGCSPVAPLTTIAPLTYTVQPGGGVTLTSGTLPTLVDRPARETTRCSYVVGTVAERASSDLTPAPTVADPAWELARASGHTESVNGGAADIEVDYEVKSGTNITFVPVVTISVPQFNRDDDPATMGTDESDLKWFAGQQFTVEFDRAPTSSTNAGCTADDTQFVFEVQLSGSVTSTEITLVDYARSEIAMPGGTPGGTPARCEYVVTYRANEDGGTLLNLVTTGADAPDTTASALDRATAATYTHAQISFAPQVVVSVPFIDNAAPATQNDLANQDIQISYAPVASPGQNAACSGFGAAPDPTETYRVGTGGTLSGGGSAPLNGAAASLVDRPAGVEARCRYQATFPASIATAAAEMFQVATATAEFEAPDEIAPAYEGNTYFTAALTLRVPQYSGDMDDDLSTTTVDESALNWYVGEQIRVTFDRASAFSSNAGCSADDTVVIYEVQGDGTVAPTPATPPVLVNVPHMQTVGCEYVAEFEASVSSDVGDVPAWTLRLQGGATAMTADVSAAGAAHTRSYLADAISFEPTVSLSVPQVDHEAGENVFAGAEFTVRFANGVNADGGAALAGCSPVSPATAIDPLTYAVQDDGTLMLTSGPSMTTPGTLPTLVDRPAQQDARCSYAITVEPAERTSAEVSGQAPSSDDIAELTWALTRAAGTTASVNGGALAIAAEYVVKTGENITFEVEANIATPQYNLDDDPTTNWFDGEAFDVMFSRTAGPATGCSPDRTLTYTIATTGTGAGVATTTGDTTFIDYPRAQTMLASGTPERCVYSVTFPDTENGGTMASSLLDLVDTGAEAPDTTTGALTHEPAATYHGQTSFAPAISIEVPFIDVEDPMDENDLATQTIEVSFVPLANPAQHNRCTSSASETHTVQTGGTTDDGGQVMLTSAAASLVDRPEGETARCRYTVNFPDQIGTAATGDFDVVAGDMGEITATGELVATYSGDIIFEPDITITVPRYNGYDDPATDPLDESTLNWYVGQEFEVEFDRAPASSTNDSCTPDDTTITYVVAGTGVVEASGSSTLIDIPDGQTTSCSYVAEFPSMLDSGDGVVPAWRLRRIGSGTATASITHGGTAVERQYLANTISYVPTVDLGVPQLDHRAADNVFAGAEFTVRFTNGVNADGGAALFGCDNPINPPTYTVQDDGTLMLTSGSLPTLIDRPGQQDAQCSYTVTVEPAERTSADVAAPGATADEAGDLTWALTLAAGATPSVTGGALAVEAEYVVKSGTDITFEFEADIAVPQFNLDDDPNTNWFDGETFDVMISRSAGPATGCSPDRTLTYTIGTTTGGAGTATTTGDTTLVDYPNAQTSLANAAERCVYSVAYDPTENGGTQTSSLLTLVATGADAPDTTASALAHEPDAKYTHTQINFAPQVLMSVPFIDNVAPTSQNDLSGQDIMISFAPVSTPSQNLGCTTSASETYRVGTGGTLSGGGSAPIQSAAASLVDRPAGVEARCRYQATFPASIATAAGETFRVRAVTADFEAPDELEPTYAGDTYFTVDITLTVPQYNGDDDPTTDPLDESTQNWYVGEQFTVEFDQASGAHADCSPDGTTFTYEVAAGGAVSPTGPTVLVDVPHMQTASCTYVAEFDASVSSDVRVVSAWTLRLQGGTSATTADVSASAAAHTRSYLADAINFVPTVDIDVPQLDHRAGENVFVGAEFEVSFAAGVNAADGAALAGCSPVGATRIDLLAYTVQPDGTLLLTLGTLPTLVDRPARQDARCSYAVTVEPAERTSDRLSDLAWALALAAGTTPSVNGGALAVEAEYEVKSGTDITFEFEADIAVPQFNVDDDPTTIGTDESSPPTNWFDGETFDVMISRSAGPATGCSPDRTLTYTIGTTSAGAGIATTTGDTTLVDYPNAQTSLADAAERCVYSVAYDPTENGGTQTSSQLILVATGTDAPDTTASALAHEPAAKYTHTQISFAPRVSVSVPFVDLAAPRGQNDLASQTIRISYAPIQTPAQNSACSGSASGTADDPTETYTIGTAGTLGGGGQVMLTSSAASLVDRPAGVEARCQYAANFADEVGTMDTGVFELAVADMARFDGDDLLRPVYSGDRFFAVDLTIAVPQYNGDNDPATAADESTQNWYVGEEFRVEFRPVPNSDDGCSAAGFEIYEVNASGSVVPADGEFALIDIPEGQTSHCAYTLSFPLSVSSDAGDVPAWTLRRQGGAAAATAGVSVTGSAVSVSYLADVIYFAPDISATVPDVDGTAAGVSVFSGLRFAVSLQRRTGAGLPADGCSAASEQSITFVVAPDGAVSGAVPTQLVDRPQGSDERCAYDVGFPAMLSSVAGAQLTWQLSAPAGVGTSVSGGAAAAASAYVVGAVSFVPEVAISVPPYNADDDPATAPDESRSNAFAGAAFVVSFGDGTGPTTGCSTTIADARFVVQPGGTVTAPANPAPGALPTLIDRPTATSGRCSYAITFPASETPGSAGAGSAGAGTELALQSGATTSVSGTAQSATARYLTAADSLFAPDVSITVEMLDSDRDQVHDLSGVLIQIDFTRAGGEPNACTESASERYVVQADGTVALAPAAADPAVDSASDPAASQSADPAASQPAELVDRPAGRNARCQYNVSYPDTLNHPDTQRRALVLPRNIATQIDGGDRLVLAYAEPPAPSPTVEPVPLMSVNTGVGRVPVRVALDVPAGVFSTGDTFEVLVSVPGACGSDTFLFGGVPASAGVSYAAKATIRGEAVLLGEGTLFVNPRATYSLPPYVDVAASGSAASSREPCAIRVTELASPPGCSLRQASGTDLLDRSYLQVAWAAGATGFDFAVSYDCPSPVEQQSVRPSLSLIQGWMTLPFNGESGTTPEQLSQMFGGVLSSIWVWDTETQDWLGWADQHGDLGLSQLARGQTLFAYSTRQVTIAYSPADLFSPPEPTGSLELAAGYNLYSFGGLEPASVSDLVAQPSPIGVIFMWDADEQSWRYNLPGRQPLANLQIEWFDTLEPGDSMFIYSIGTEATSIPWA